MYVPVPSALSRVLWMPVLLGALLLTGLSVPVGHAGDRVSSVAPKVPPEAAAHEDESLPLTDAQQAAKRLAATLEEERPAAATSASGPAVVPLTEPGLRYQRLMIKLYTSDRVEVRVVSGRQTFASPVDTAAVDDSDARRPTLLHAEDGAIAIEVLVE